MLHNNKIAREVAKGLLDIQAVRLNPSQPFTWASGMKSPIYCDNRKTLAYPAIRSQIRQGFVEMIQQYFPSVNLIAGVATGAIAQGALVADSLELPYVYVRDKPKAHGMGNVIEGHIAGGEKAVVVEDLISTGGSSLKAVEALRAAGVEVLGLVAIFTYSFKEAEERMQQAQVPFYTLSDYPTLIQYAAEAQAVQPSAVETLMKWYENPSVWITT
jgi:orotate phosphoribosyltransferase